MPNSDYPREFKIQGLTLNIFEQSYISTMLWSSTDDEGSPLDREFGIIDLTPCAIQLVKFDCERFQTENSELLNIARDLLEIDDAQIAHDFCLTRNHHGAGFWDGDYSFPIPNHLKYVTRNGLRLRRDNWLGEALTLITQLEYRELNPSVTTQGDRDWDDSRDSPQVRLEG